MSIKVPLRSSQNPAPSRAPFDDSPEHFVATHPSTVSSSEGEERVNIAVVSPYSGFSTLDYLKSSFGRFDRQMKIGVLLFRALLLKSDEAKKGQLLGRAIEYADEGIEIFFDEIRRFGLNNHRTKVFNEIYGQRMAILHSLFETTADFNLLIEYADLLRKSKTFEEFMMGHQLENAKHAFTQHYEVGLAKFVEILSAHFYHSLLEVSGVDPLTFFKYLKIMASKSGLATTRAVPEQVLLDLVKVMVARGEFEQAAELIVNNKDVFVSGCVADVHLKITFEEFVKAFEEAMPKRIALILDGTGTSEAALKAGAESFKIISEAIMQTLRMAPARRALAVFNDSSLSAAIKNFGFDAGGVGQVFYTAEIKKIVARYFSYLSGVELKLFGAEADAQSYFRSLAESTLGKPLRLGGSVFYGIRPPDFRPAVMPDSGLVVTSIEHKKSLPQALLDELRLAERELSKSIGGANRSRLRLEKK